MPEDLTPGVVLGASNVWGATGSTCTGGSDATCSTTVWHWNGTTWINAYQVGSLPGGDGFALLGMATIPGSSSIWGTGWAGRSATNHTQDSLIAVYGGTP